MTKRKRRRQLSATLATALVLTPLMTPIAHANTATPQALAAKTAPTTKAGPINVRQNTIEQSKNQLASGISEEKVTYNNGKGDRTVMHTVAVDLKDQSTGLYAGTPDDGATSGLQTVRSEANAAIKNGQRVVAGLNADFFNMGTGEPSGNVVKNGTEIHAAKANSGEAFFGVLKDGTPIIGDQGDYDKHKGNLQQALGGLGVLVKDGVAQSGLWQPGTANAARTAVGIKADKTVFFVTIDGNQAPYSNGLSIDELAQTMKNQGAVQALNLDGGGSASYLSRTPGEQDLSLKNRPSDGKERAVGNSWLIVTKEKSTHAFDHARVTPKDHVYTPTATVHFTAKGVDKAGYSAALPTSGLTWSVKDDRLGKIDAQTGAFTANGQTGDVTATLRHNGQVVGSSTITIATPDSLDFLNAKLSLKTNATASLGLTVRAKGRDVNLNPGDVQWTVPAELGTVDGQGQLRTAGGPASGVIKASIPGTTLTKDVAVQIGQLPTTLYDFEDGLKGWSVSGSHRGEDNQIALANPEDGQVRFGNHALRLDFDMTKGQQGTTLGAYAGPSDSKPIPGAPTAIGMWVYGTPEAQGYWLRSQIYDGKGGIRPLNFTTPTEGINWLGWKYVEAPISPDFQGPFKTFPNQVVRLMTLKSGTPKGGPMTKGSLFVDNVRAVYGANVDDLKSPVITDINVANRTFKDNQITITTKAHDVAEPNMSGIDWAKNKLFVDGQDMTTNGEHYSYDPDGTMTLRGYQFADGVHHVKAVVYDQFGNRTDKDTYFTVATGNRTQVSLQAPQPATATLGGTAQFSVTAADTGNVRSGDFTINLAKGFPVKDVKFAHATAKNSYDYDPQTGVLNVHLTDNGAAKGANHTLFDVVVDVPQDTPTSAKLTTQLVSGRVVFNDLNNNADMVNTVASKPITVPIQGDYRLKLDQLIVGAAGTITVVDAKNQPVSGASVTMQVKDKATVVGQTDARGQLHSEALTKEAGKFTLTASRGQHHSFATDAQAFMPQKTDAPVDLLAGSSQDPTTQKTITWFTNPITNQKPALMQVATDKAYQADGARAFQTQKGTQKTLTYVADNSAIQLNRVDARGLKPGTAYTYRVGNGEKWSAVRHFKTLTKTDHLTFNIFGDTQVNDPKQLADFDKIVKHLETVDKPDFALHVGDFNDDQAIFKEADMTAHMFDQHPVFDSIDMVHVLGNHEYMGDDGSKATAMLGVPGNNGPAINRKGTYSVDYGNVHIASIGWTDNVDEMKQEMDWLRNDMRASKATWKMVATHQPAFNKNPADAQSTLFHKMLPPVCDELGIDVIFSGHDHSYGRTKALLGGKENAKGTTYVAAGHTGDKTYDIDPNEKDVWAYIQKEADKQQKVYLTALVAGNKLTLTTKDVANQVIDQTTLTAHHQGTSPEKPGKPTPEKPGTDKPTPEKPTTEQPSTGDHGHGETTVPRYVTAIRSLRLYKSPNFSIWNRMNVFLKLPFMKQPQFKVLGVTTDKHGAKRYHVRDTNRHSWTHGKTGYVTASPKYVQAAYFEQHVKQVTVTAPAGLNAYRTAKLTGKVKHHYRQGTLLHVKRLVMTQAGASFQLHNGLYVSANKHDVEAGNGKHLNKVVTMQGVTVYRDVNFTHKVRHIAANRAVEVLGWDYSDKGALRYRVQDGYITGTHASVN